MDVKYIPRLFIFPGILSNSNLHHRRFPVILKNSKLLDFHNLLWLRIVGEFPVFSQFISQGLDDLIKQQLTIVERQKLTSIDSPSNSI